MLNSKNKKEEVKTSEKSSASLDEKSEKKNKNQFSEIIRFALVGALCTVIDFGISFLFLKIFKSNLSTIPNWGGYLSFAISGTISFFVSSVVNFIFSRIYVFKNVDRNIKTNNQRTFWVFIALGVGGWLIGIGIQELGVYICNVAWNLDLSLDVTTVSFQTLFQTGGIAFWVFVAIFCIKTGVSLIYNYITRKLFIFKAPKA
jgi:putative flippase GtrA